MDAAILVGFAIGALIFLIPIILMKISSIKSRWLVAEKLNQLTIETRSFIESLEQSREFPDVNASGLHLSAGEFLVRRERATLAKFTRARVGGGIGTRVRVAGFPIYIGGSKSIPTEELREAGAGDLVLTNRRLFFLGAQTVTVPFDKLLKCEQIDAGLIISASGRERPHILVLENAGLWCFLVNWVAKHQFENRRLPNDMHLAVTGQPPSLEVHVSCD
jgi:hypothetical protein